jgi:hypothetical protein
MSSKQAARKRGASERAQVERCNEPAPLCSFTGTAVTPVPHAVGMRTPANAVRSRHDSAWTVHEHDGGDSMSSKQLVCRRADVQTVETAREVMQ